MGQRHQVYVIASVVPHGSKYERYRCVAVLHHQWCYGRFPLKALHRFLTLIKKPDHAKVIRSELDALDGKYGPYADVEPTIPYTPCPYLTFLLQSAYRVDLDLQKDPYLEDGHSTYPASMYTFHGDNDDGLTFVELTNPCDPAYCMTHFDTQIVTAEQYVRKYYPINEYGVEVEQDVIYAISLNANERLITLDILAEAWPKEYRSAYVLTLTPGEKAPKSEQHVPPVAAPVIPSLVDLTLSQAIEAIIQSGQTDLVSHLFMLPGKAALVKTALRNREAVPDAAVSLLASTLTYQLQTEKITKLNLTDFVSWSGAQISQVISLIPQDLLASVEMVDLSYNPQLSSCDIIEEVLKHIPSLRRLDILDTSIDISTLSSLISTKFQLFTHLETLLHPALLQYDLDYERTEHLSMHKSGFSCVMMRVYDGLYAYSNIPVTAAYLPIWSLNMIIQSLTDLLSAFMREETLYDDIVFNNFRLLQTAFGSSRDAQTQSWSQRLVPLLPFYSKLGFTGAAGWMFVLTGQPVAKQWAYGFIKVDEEKIKTPTAQSDPESMSDLWQICDLDGFLRQVESEGRPLPPHHVVEELRNLLATFSDPPPIPEGFRAVLTDCKTGLMDDETFARMVRSNVKEGSELSLAQCLIELSK